MTPTLHHFLEQQKVKIPLYIHAVLPFTSTAFFISHFEDLFVLTISSSILFKFNKL
jgi:hypothetical protein